jgi:hypothetical protein
MMQFNNADDLKERGFQLLSPPVTIVGVDPSGDGDDKDGVVAVSREEHQRGMPHDPDFAVEYVYRIMLAHQLRKDYEFPDKLASLLQLDKKLQQWTRQRRQTAHFFAVETNGVGYGYASSLARKTQTKILPYATVGRVSNTTRPPGNAKIAMPRLEALDNTRILTETGYLKVAPGAPGIDDLQKQMQAFVWRGKNRPEAMEGQHDDLVLALTGALWMGSKIIPPVLKQVKLPGAVRKPSHGRMRVH